MVAADVDGHLVDVVLVEIDIDQGLPDIVGLLVTDADRQVLLVDLVAVDVLETVFQRVDDLLEYLVFAIP